MDDWSHGYDVSVGYTYGFCREIAPGWLDLCALLAGQAPPSPAPSAPLRYLELGMGQGMGIVLLAAANPHIEFLGIDFHPEHVAHAQGLADAAGLRNIRFSQADFVALADRWPTDFGSFDYVVLHGVYSWISPQVRAALVQCLTHATAPGGLVYNGYNAQPGWLGTMPFQHITRRIKESSGQESGAVLRDSIALFDRLRTGGAATFQILPGLKARLDSVKTKSVNYLVGEYLHENWHPLWHSEVAGELAGADLHYAGTATVAETMLPDLLPPSLRDTILDRQDASLRQDLQDFVTNQFFRRDLFRRPPVAQAAPEALSGIRLCLLSPPAGDVEVKTSFGEILLQRPAFAEIVETLAAQGPQSFATLAALPGMRRQGAETARQIILLLLQARTLAVAPAVPGDAALAQRLNGAIAQAASRGVPYDHIAAAAIGSAIAVTQIDLILLNAWLSSSNRTDATEISRRLETLGHPLPQEAAIEGFLRRTVPQWQALGALER